MYGCLPQPSAYRTTHSERGIIMSTLVTLATGGPFMILQSIVVENLAWK